MTRVRRGLAAAATLGVTLGAIIAPSVAQAAPTGDSIVTIAKRELGDSSRNYEIPVNCSYYGGVMFGWPACGGKAGWGGGGSAYAWCAAFAKYVWREGGVTSGMSQINGYAASFKSYGQNNGTWHARGSYVPKPGDAVTFDWGNDGDVNHVGIVKSVSGSTLYTIEGNTSDRVAAHTYYNFASNYEIEGFTTALGVTSGGTSSPPDPWIADVTGDGYHDVVATKTDGTLWLYSNNFNRDGGIPYSDVRQIGNGWGGFAHIINADATGDGFADLLGVKPDGTMLLYSNNFVRDDGTPYSDVRQIGTGWNNFVDIIPADATGDGFTDLLGIKSDGTMWLYSNNFVRDGGIPYSDKRQIGTGWNNFASVIPADATGDGFTDLLGVKSDGTMLLYSNNFVRDGGIPYSDKRQIGTGWNNFNRIM